MHEINKKLKVFRIGYMQLQGPVTSRNVKYKQCINDSVHTKSTLAITDFLMFTLLHILKLRRE